MVDPTFLKLGQLEQAAFEQAADKLVAEQAADKLVARLVAPQVEQQVAPQVASQVAPPVVLGCTFFVVDLTLFHIVDQQRK